MDAGGLYPGAFPRPLGAVPAGAGGQQGGRVRAPRRWQHLRHTSSPSRPAASCPSGRGGGSSCVFSPLHYLLSSPGVLRWGKGRGEHRQTPVEIAPSGGLPQSGGAVGEEMGWGAEGKLEKSISIKKHRKAASGCGRPGALEMEAFLGKGSCARGRARDGGCPVPPAFCPARILCPRMQW